jgi:hypothetical protein
MTAAWLLNALQLFLATSGALLMFLHLCKPPVVAVDAPASDVRRAYETDRRRVMLGVGLLAAAFLLQYAGIFI